MGFGFYHGNYNLRLLFYCVDYVGSYVNIIIGFRGYYYDAFAGACIDIFFSIILLYYYCDAHMGVWIDIIGLI